MIRIARLTPRQPLAPFWPADLLPLY